jgi:hypothetical protein
VPSIGGIFGEGSSAQQFLMWNVASQIASALLDPLFRQIGFDVNTKTPNVPLTPDISADFVERNIISQATGEAIAAQNGINKQNFQWMVDGAGEPPGLDFVLEAYRRGFIPFGPATTGEPSVETAIRTGRIYDYWTGTIDKMRYSPIATADAVDAAVENQISQEAAAAIAQQNGIDQASFQILFDTRGNPPAPSELMTLVNRGLIPLEGTGPEATTFQQGIAEGATKDKWTDLLAQLRVYIPSVYYLNQLAEAGTLTAAQVAGYYADLGIPAPIATGLAAQASGSKTAKAKELTVSQVTTAYQEGFLTEAQATTFITALGYTPAEVTLLLEIEEFSRILKAYNQTITKIASYYVANKLTAIEAKAALQQVQVPEDQATQLISAWNTQKSLNVRLLTEAQIADAFYLEIISQDTAINELGGLGYSPQDAWILLSVKAKIALPNPPSGPIPIEPPPATGNAPTP